MQIQSHTPWPQWNRSTRELSTVPVLPPIFVWHYVTYDPSPVHAKVPHSLYTSVLPKHDYDGALTARQHHQPFPDHQRWGNDHSKVQHLVIQLEGVGEDKRNGQEWGRHWEHRTPLSHPQGQSSFQYLQFPICHSQEDQSEFSGQQSTCNFYLYIQVFKYCSHKSQGNPIPDYVILR